MITPIDRRRMMAWIKLTLMRQIPELAFYRAPGPRQEQATYLTSANELLALSIEGTVQSGWRARHRHYSN
jgi:hypothetical protein